MRESLRDNGGLTTNSRGGEKQTSLIRFNLRHNNGRNTLPSSPGARRRCSTGHIGRSSALTCYCTARHDRRGLRRTLTCPSPTLCGTADNSILDFVAAPEVLFTNNRKSGGNFPATINKCRTLLHGQGIGLAQQVPDAPPWTGHWTGSTSAVRPSMDWALDWLRAIRPSMDRALDWFRVMTTGPFRRVFNTFLNTILSPQWPSILTRDTHAASHNVTTKRL